MSPPTPPPAPADKHLSWRHPPFGTLVILMIAFGYARPRIGDTGINIELITAWIVGSSPLLLFIHLGKNRFAKQWITALFMLPFLFLAYAPIIQTDDPPPLPGPIWERMYPIISISFLVNLVLLLFAFLAYRDWKRIRDKQTKEQIDASRQERKT